MREEEKEEVRSEDAMKAIRAGISTLVLFAAAAAALPAQVTAIRAGQLVDPA